MLNIMFFSSFFTLKWVFFISVQTVWLCLRHWYFSSGNLEVCGTSWLTLFKGKRKNVSYTIHLIGIKFLKLWCVFTKYVLLSHAQYLQVKSSSFLFSSYLCTLQLRHKNSVYHLTLLVHTESVSHSVKQLCNFTCGMCVHTTIEQVVL